MMPSICVRESDSDSIQPGEYVVRLVRFRITPGFREPKAWFELELADGRRVVAHTNVSQSLSSEFVRWVSTLLGIKPRPGVKLNPIDAVGKAAIAEIADVICGDGTTVRRVVSMKPLQLPSQDDCPDGVAQETSVASVDSEVLRRAVARERREFWKWVERNYHETPDD